MLAGNIGKFSLTLRQPGRVLSLSMRWMTDDDVDAALRPVKKRISLWSRTDVVSILGTRQEKMVTIYSRTDCKLYSVVREGEFFRTPKPYIYGDRSGLRRGGFNEWRSRF